MTFGTFSTEQCKLRWQSLVYSKQRPRLSNPPDFSGILPLLSSLSRIPTRRDNSDPACPQALLHCYLIVQYRHTAYEYPAIGVLECTCGTMAAIMNYNGRGDVSSARAALGAIIVNTVVTLRIRTYIYTLCSRASATRRKAEPDQRCLQSLLVNF